MLWGNLHQLGLNWKGGPEGGGKCRVNSKNKEKNKQLSSGVGNDEWLLKES